MQAMSMLFLSTFFLNYLLFLSPISAYPYQLPEFLKTTIRQALDHAIYARTEAHVLAPKCKSEGEKAALADCLELYDLTILKLNHTIYTKSIQVEDAQTWLSTALTNMDTCRTGFVELGITDSMILPILSLDSISDLISSTFAINKLSPYSTNSRGNNHVGFPTWVKPGDRKLLQSSVDANLVVAQDGSGDCETVMEAISSASGRSSGRFVIYVKAGLYKENVAIKSNNIMLVGDGMGKTILTGSRSVGGGSTTFNSATVAIIGDGFIARDITFRNSAGGSSHQAVALLSQSDHSVFYRCSFEGYQDTLYVLSNRQFYKDCNIYGNQDFIFGNAAAVFQSCNIYVRYWPNDKTNIITAQGRTNPNQNTGISIQNCRVTAASDFQSHQGSVKTYLGRPWKEYSRTVFMKSYLDSLITPAGWSEWSGGFALKTLYYGEYSNTGPGSATGNRVKWPGYHVMDGSEASKFTVNSLISGSSWLPATKVPFTDGI